MMAQGQHFTDWSAGVHLTLRFDIADFFCFFLFFRLRDIIKVWINFLESSQT